MKPIKEFEPKDPVEIEIKDHVEEAPHEDKEGPTKPIREFDGEYKFLSNFHPARVFLPGEDPLTYPSVEAAYQAAKTTKIKDRTPFKVASPGVAKRLGKKLKLREDWEDVKVSIMLYLLRTKFSEKSLRQKLLDTKDVELVEGNYWKDTFWGVYEGVGENQLGKLLMKVRREIRDSV